MEITTEILGKEYLISFSIRITSRGGAATGPTYDCGGEPAYPCEWEIDGEPEVWSLKLADVPKRQFIDGKFQTVMVKEWVKGQRLDLSDWLSEAITEWLGESDEVAEMADMLADEDDERGEDDAAEYRRDCAREDSI
jgi:hypothetical protein